MSLKPAVIIVGLAFSDRHDSAFADVMPLLMPHSCSSQGVLTRWCVGNRGIYRGIGKGPSHRRPQQQNTEALFSAQPASQDNL